MKRNLLLCLLLLLLTLVSINGQSGRSRPSDNGNTKKSAQPQEPKASPQPENKDNTVPDDFQGEEILKINTDLVSIPVSVIDRQGRNIFDLKKEDFQLFEDGKPQEIAFFDTTEQPFTVVLMLDISLSTKFKITDIQNAAIAFLDQLRPEDRVMVIAFAEDVFTLSAFTSDRAQLRRAIRGTKFKDGTSIYDAFQLTTFRLQRIAGKKAIVMFTDGVDTTSRKSYLGENLRDADELDAIIFPIEFNTFADVMRMERNGGIDVPDSAPKTDGPLSLPTVVINQDVKAKQSGTGNTEMDDRARELKMEYEKAAKYLADLAYRTGGKVEKATSLYDIEKAFTRIAQGLRQQYSIGYYPPDIEKTGVARKIKVKVTRPNVVVKSRDTYTIGEAAKKKPVSGQK